MQSLDDVDTLCRVTEVVAAYCDKHGADHIADLVERASMLIAQPRELPSYRLRIGWELVFVG